ncbi:hypothetical protein MBLNU230_g8428t1 [Neophaeotheca triangularis]
MAETCAKCSGLLVIDLADSDSEGDNPMSNDNNTIPDDVHLPCACHFHWECLVDNYELGKCPSCSANITSTPSATASSSSSTPSQEPKQQVLVTLHNEGGVQENLDILPILTEEAYLRAYPEERRSRAFLEFCREGDHRAVIDVLTRPQGDEDEDDDDEGDVDMSSPNTLVNSKSPDQILRYQDPLAHGQSGLHAAAANGHREVAWLLLLLASEVPEMEFPALVFQEAAALGVMRESQEGKADIRGLRDEFGRSAEDVARESGSAVWQGWIGSGRLALPGGGGGSSSGAVTV